MARVILLNDRRFGDDRGWFAETYSERAMAALGIACHFVQDNHSYSKAVGTLRGLHFQRPPSAQAKLVRCLKGRIFDVAVDLRKGSPTYGRHVAVELSAENARQIFVPMGFAHGFVTLSPDTEVAYKVSAFYDPSADAGLRWNDPTIPIPWPLPDAGPVLSARDTALPLLDDFDSPFPYDGEPLEPLSA